MYENLMSLKLIDLNNIRCNVILYNNSFSEMYFKNNWGLHFNFDNYDNRCVFIIFLTRIFNLISQNKNINWIKKPSSDVEFPYLNDQLTKLVTMQIRRSWNWHDANLTVTIIKRWSGRKKYSVVLKC